MAMSGNYHLLFGLSTNTPQYEYQSHKNFLSILDEELSLFAVDQSRSQYILFTGVSNEVFRRNFIHPKDGLTDFESYSTTHDLIIVKMQSRNHACANSTFTFELVAKLMTMGGYHEHIRGYGGAHVRGDDRMKRAGQLYQPRILPRNRSRHWPSLVLETGQIEEQQKLKTDIDWWITQSKGDVKSAITIAFNSRVKQMLICQWYGSNSKREMYQNELSLDDRGDMKTSNPNPLIIPFENLFLRPPSGDEQDIIFTIADLENFARRVWEVQFEDESYESPGWYQPVSAISHRTRKPPRSLNHAASVSEGIFVIPNDAYKECVVLNKPC